MKNRGITKTMPSGGKPVDGSRNLKAEHKVSGAEYVLIHALVFFSGMTVMAVELAASRLFAPFFGTTVFVWSGLIGALLVFLAIGYYVGGLLSRKGLGRKVLFGITLLASAATAAAPFAARPVMTALTANAGPADSLLPAIIIASAAALAPVLVPLGCVLPLATGILSRADRDAGQVAGGLYAVSTVGSVVGVFAPVLITLPTVGTRLTFIIFAGILAAVSIVGLVGAKFLPVAAAAFPLLGYATAGAPIKSPPPTPEIRLAESETLYNYTQITREGPEVRMLIDNGWFMYSKIIEGKALTDSYRDYFALAGMFSSDADFPAEILILGAAGGADARVLKHIYPRSRVTGVEIDPGLLELGRRHMGLDDYIDRTVVGDGRAFLRSSDEKFDLIVLDSQTYIPFHMTTKEFFLLAKERLTDRGVVAFNVAWRSFDDWALLRRCADTLDAVFPSIFIRTMPNRLNTVLFASKSQVDMSALENNIATRSEIIPRELSQDNAEHFHSYSSDGNPFTDDLAPVEYYTDSAIRKVFGMLESRRRRISR
jgi:spermidine synthase